MSSNVFVVKQFKVPVYGSYVVFIIFNDNWDRVLKTLRRRGFDTSSYDDWDYVFGLQVDEYIKGHRRFAVLIEYNENRAHMEEVLVHELFHLTQAILEYKSVKFVKGGDNEPYAYLIGTLYEKMAKYIP